MIMQTLRSRLTLASALYMLVAALFLCKTQAALATDSTINNSLDTRDVSLQQADAEDRRHRVPSAQCGRLTCRRPFS